MVKAEYVWTWSIVVFLILAAFWMAVLPETYSIALNQSTDEALVFGNVTIFENYGEGSRIEVNEANMDKTILCSNLGTFIKQVGNETVIKDVVVNSTAVTTTYRCLKFPPGDHDPYQKPVAVVKYIEVMAVAMPFYYKGELASSVSAGEIKVRRCTTRMMSGVVLWMVFYAACSFVFLEAVLWCWDKCRLIKQKVVSATKGLKSKLKPKKLVNKD